MIDCKITPASGLIDFIDSGLSVGSLLWNGTDILLSAVGGKTRLGNAASDVYIGTGTGSTDLWMEQDGRIAGAAGRVLTLGKSDSSLRIASPELRFSYDPGSGEQTGGIGIWTSANTDLNALAGAPGTVVWSPSGGHAAVALDSDSDTDAFWVTAHSGSASGPRRAQDRTLLKLPRTGGLTLPQYSAGVASFGAGGVLTSSASLSIALGGTGATSFTGSRLIRHNGTNFVSSAYDEADFARIAGTHTISGAYTYSSLLTSTASDSFYLNATGSNLIRYNGNGVAAPTFTTRSAGSKIVLFPAMSGSSVDIGFGVDSSTLWSAVRTTSDFFKWYGGVTLAATLTGAGNLSLAGTASATQFTSTVAIGTAPLVVTSTTKVTNLNADRLDDQEGAYYLAWANFTGEPTTVEGYGITNAVRTDLSSTITAALLTISNADPGLAIVDSNATADTRGFRLRSVGGEFRIQAFTDAGVGGSEYLSMQRSGNNLVTWKFGDQATPTLLVDEANDRIQVKGSTVWHAGNMGASSTLDADLLDGQHGSYYRDLTNVNAGILTIARGGTNAGSFTTANRYVLFDGTRLVTGSLGASDIVPYASATYTPGAVSVGWFRVASSPVNIGRVTGRFRFAWQNAAGTQGGMVVVEASCVFGDNEGTALHQLHYADSDGAGFTKARVVYHNTPLGASAHLEVYMPGSYTLGSCTTTLLDGVSWTLAGSLGAGSIPGGYVSKELNFNAGLVIAGTVSADQFISNVGLGTAPFVVGSTTVVTNLNADLLDGQHGAHYLNPANLSAMVPVTLGGTGRTSAPTASKFLYYDGTKIEASSFYDTDFAKTSGSVTLANPWTFSDTLTLTKAGGSDALFLNGATSNWIRWSNVGGNAPTFTTRSTGTRIILYDDLSASSADYALGIEGSNLWFSVGTTSRGFKFYGGTTLAATISGAGVVTAVTSVSAPRLISTVSTGTAPFTVTSTTVVANLNADLLDGQQGSYYIDPLNLSASVPVTKGGTGRTTAPTANRFLIYDGSQIEASAYDQTSFLTPSTGGTLTGSWTFASRLALTGGLQSLDHMYLREGKALVFNASTSPNFEYVYFDDTANVFHFVADSGTLNMSATGNAGITAGSFTGVGSGLTGLSAANISAGTLPIARGGTNATSYSANDEFLWFNGTSLVASGFDATSFARMNTVLSGGGGSLDMRVYRDVAYYAGAGSVTGEIVITLPVYYNDCSMTLEILIYNYDSAVLPTDSRPTKLLLTGFLNAADNTWRNVTVEGGTDIQVRVGHNTSTSKCAVFIGATATAWANPRVLVSKVYASNTNSSTLASGWAVSVITSETGYSIGSAIVLNRLLNADLLDGQHGSYYQQALTMNNIVNVGSGLATNQVATLSLHSDASGTGTLQLDRSSGANGLSVLRHRGTGDLDIELVNAAALVVSVNGQDAINVSSARMLNVLQGINVTGTTTFNSAATFSGAVTFSSTVDLPDFALSWTDQRLRDTQAGIPNNAFQATNALEWNGVGSVLAYNAGGVPASAPSAYVGVIAASVSNVEFSNSAWIEVTNTTDSYGIAASIASTAGMLAGSILDLGYQHVTMAGVSTSVIVSSNNPTSAAWVRTEDRFTVAAGAGRIRLWGRIRGVASATGSWYMTNFSFIRGSEALFIADGSLGGSRLIDASVTSAKLDSVATAGTYRSLTVNAQGRVTSGSNPTTLSGYGITDAQALDATLTAMAGVTTAADRYIYFTGVDTAAIATVTADGRAILAAANYAAMRTNLGLVVGTNVQAYDATLAALAGVTTAADTILYFTGVDASASTSLTAFGRSLIDDADAAAARTTLGAAAASHTHAWTDITGEPTTLSGYGITDAISNTLTTNQSIVGDLSISRASGVSTLTINSVAGQNTYITFARAGSSRWTLMGDNTTESGSNVGTDFRIMRRDDAGVFVDYPVSITRSTGRVTFSADPYVGANKIYHAGNDGPSSGLDADVLDGFEGSHYLNPVNLSSAVPISKGGTNASSFTSNRIVRFNGTSLVSGSYDEGDFARIAGTHTISGAYTFSTTITSTVTGAVDNILLNGTTSNWIMWSATGTSAPTTTTRSPGSKLVLYPAISASAVDYALGVESNNLWLSVQDDTASYGIKFYGATTMLARIGGDGKLELPLGLIQAGNASSAVAGVRPYDLRYVINTANNNSGLYVHGSSTSTALSGGSGTHGAFFTQVVNLTTAHRGANYGWATAVRGDLLSGTDSDLSDAYGGYFRAVNMTAAQTWGYGVGVQGYAANDAGTITTSVGVVGRALARATSSSTTGVSGDAANVTGVVTSTTLYGGRFWSTATNGFSGTIMGVRNDAIVTITDNTTGPTTVYGSYNQVALNSTGTPPSITTIFGVTSIIDNNAAAAVNTSYLFYGEYMSLSHAPRWGLYLVGEAKNYISNGLYIANASYSGSAKLHVTGDVDVTGNVVIAGTPSLATHAVNKSYVDAVATGLKVKTEVRVSSTANLNVSAPGAAIDGVTLANGNRVLVRHQTTTSQNGLYVFNGAASAMTRTSDMDTWDEFPGAFVFVTEGATQTNTGWTCTATPGGTVGSTAVAWAQFAGGGNFTSSNGIVLSANDFALTGQALALHNLATNGLVARTASGAFSARSIAQPAAGITISNGDGVAGNPTLALANDLGAVEALATTGFVRRTGTDTWSASAIANSDLPVSGATAGTYNSVTINDRGVVTGASNVSYQSLDATLTAFAGLTSAADKIAYFTASDVMATADFTTLGRSVVGASTAAIAATALGLGTGSSPTFSALTVTNNITAADPTAASHVVTRGWLENRSNKDSVRVATTANLTVTATTQTLTNSGTLAALSIDSTTLSVGNRVLVKDQTLAQNNGIYTVTTAGSGAVAWVLTRSTDADVWADVGAATVAVEEGTVNRNTIWFSTANASTGTLGTTAIAWQRVNNPLLAALGGVTGAADRLIYLTGAEAAAVTVFTSYARTLLDDADAATARTTLGLVTVASSGSAADLTTGVLADARLSGVYSGVTLNLGATNTIFSSPNSGSPHTGSRSVSHLAEFRSNSSSATGAIVFIAPSSLTAIMHQIEVRGHVYSANKQVDMIVQGYRSNSTTWQNPGKMSRGSLDVRVRWGYDSGGKTVLVLGDVGTVWSYPHFVLTKAMFSHSGVVDAYCYGWTVAQVTDFTGYTLTSDVVENAIESLSSTTAVVGSGGLTVGSGGITSAGQITTTTSNALKLKSGASASNYGVIFNVSSSAFYLLYTNSGDADGTFNGFRPLRLNFASNAMSSDSPWTFSEIITINSGGTSAPTFSTRSAGTRIILWDALSSTNADYALGMAGSELWLSVPNNTTSGKFRWYAGVTQLMELLSGATPLLTVSGNVRADAAGIGTAASTSALLNVSKSAAITATTNTIGAQIFSNATQATMAANSTVYGINAEASAAQTHADVNGLNLTLYGGYFNAKSSVVARSRATAAYGSFSSVTNAAASTGTANDGLIDFACGAFGRVTISGAASITTTAQGSRSLVEVLTAGAQATNLTGSEAVIDYRIAGTVTKVEGVVSRVSHSGSGTFTTAYGFHSLLSNQSTGAMPTAYGVRSQIFNNSTGTITSGYLFYGNYAGAAISNVADAWGLYITAEDKNYISNGLYIANASYSGGAKLHVTGAVDVVGAITATGLAQFSGGISITGTVTLPAASIANAALETVATAGTYRSVTVNAQGRVTSGTNPTTLTGYGITDAQPLDATLTTMAGLATVADRLIYFTGADTAALATLTTFGRSLIDDADNTAARTTLGLGTVAIENTVPIAKGGTNATSYGANNKFLVFNGTSFVATAFDETSFVTPIEESADSGTLKTYHYRNPFYFAGASSETGILKIRLPKGWTDTFLMVKLVVWSYATSTANVRGLTEISVSGYNDTSALWRNTKANVIGNAYRVRLAHDGTAACLLIGDTSTTWAYSRILVTDVYTSGASSTGWDTGWTASVIASETGITAVAEPTRNDGISVPNVQPLDPTLTALAGLSTAADNYVYFTGSDTPVVGTISSFGRSLVDDVDSSTARTTLGLAIGTNVQAYNAGLASLSGLTGAGVVTATGTSTFAMRAIGVASGTDILTRADGDGRYPQKGGTETVSGTWTFSAANTVFSGATGLTLSNATSTLLFTTNTSPAAPTFITRSTGTKISLWGSTIDADDAEYAIGVEMGHVWFSVPSVNISRGFKWYGGTTSQMSLYGAPWSDVSGSGSITRLDIEGDLRAKGFLNVGSGGESSSAIGRFTYDFPSTVLGGTRYGQLVEVGWANPTTTTNAVVEGMRLTLDPQFTAANSGAYTASLRGLHVLISPTDTGKQHYDYVTGVKVAAINTSTTATTADATWGPTYANFSEVEAAGSTSVITTGYGGYFSARTSGSGSMPEAYGIFSETRIAGTAEAPNIYGAYSQALVTGATTVSNAYGVYGRARGGVTGSTITNAVGVYSFVDTVAGATITTGYLFRGIYTNGGTISTRWGLYLTGEAKNYLSAALHVGNASYAGAAALHVTGAVDITTSLTVGNGLTVTSGTVSLPAGSLTGLALTDATVTSAKLDAVTTAGTYRSVTVNAQGRVTAGTNPTTLAGYGISDAQTLDATLTAMAGVTTAADRIIYFTGVDAAAATPLTAYGRSLIDDADATAARTTLGLGTVAIESTVPVNKGGTGQSSAPSNGAILIGNGTGFTLTGLTGTTSQVLVTNAAGSITLSLPQNINTTGTPTFGGLNLSGTFISTEDNADNIFLNGPTANWIRWRNAGSGPPAFTTRSVGTKLVFWSMLDADSTEHALGVDGANLWFSVPDTAAGYNFRWYAGTTLVASLSGAGAFAAAKATLSQGNDALVFDNATSNTVSFGTNGVGAPTFTTRSVGTKISLNSSAFTGSSAEYAIGIESNTLWMSVPTLAANRSFKWYGGITKMAELNGDNWSGSGALLSVIGDIDATGYLNLGSLSQRTDVLLNVGKTWTTTTTGVRYGSFISVDWSGTTLTGASRNEGLRVEASMSLTTAQRNGQNASLRGIAALLAASDATKSGLDAAFGFTSQVLNGGTSGTASDATWATAYGYYSDVAAAGTTAVNTYGYGGWFQSRASGSGKATNSYGVYASALQESTSSATEVTGVFSQPKTRLTSTATEMNGVYASAELEGTSTVTTAYGLRSVIKTATGTTVTTGYLFHGNYATSGTVTNRWGLYVTGEAKSYLSNALHIANAAYAGAAKLHVTGAVDVVGGITISNSLAVTAGTVTLPAGALTGLALTDATVTNAKLDAIGTAGTYRSVTVNAQGRVTAGTNLNFLAQFGITDTSNIVQNPNFTTDGTNPNAEAWTGTTAQLYTTSGIPSGAPAEFVGRVNIGSGTVNAEINGVRSIAATPGETFFYDFWLAPTTDVNGGIVFAVRVGAADDSNSQATVLTVPTTNQGWMRYSGHYTVPATVSGEPVTKIRFYFRPNTQASPVGAWFIASPKIRRSTNMEMIAATGTASGTTFLRGDGVWATPSGGGDTNSANNETITGQWSFTQPILGTTVSAYMADVAERYAADDEYDPGTVLVFGGDQEVTACAHHRDHRVAGVVSDRWAHLMNAAAGSNETHPAVGLVGRVWVKVVGQVQQGDLLVTSDVRGHAVRIDANESAGNRIIGRAIGYKTTNEPGRVEVALSR